MTMSIFTDLIRTMPRSDDCPDISKIKIPRNYEEYLQWQCEAFNRTVGNLEGYDCPECLNRGYISRIADDVIVQRECNCMKIRNSPFRIENSGLKKLKDFDRFTFDMYRTDTEWRKRAKTTALKYVKENNGKWLFFGGQSGTGKTHLCTAICKKLIIQGHDVKYVLWRDILHFLDSNRFNYDNYREKMENIQNYEVLYIDDFLKTSDRRQLANDMNYAYEIINSRSLSSRQTIISSEMFISEITELDEATGGRINDMSENFQIQIKREKDRNFRIYGKGETV